MATTLHSLFAGVVRRWKLVAAIVFLSGIAAVALALAMTPIYRSEAIVVFASDDVGLGGLGGLAGQLGGLAALAGLPSGMGQSRAEAIGVLKSRSIVERLITTEKLLPSLFPRQWNAQQQRWMAGANEPTLGDAVLLFQRNILSVREDIKSGLLTVRVEWSDRHRSAEWANKIVSLANEVLRDRSIAESTAALESLAKEARATESVELRTALSRLMEGQLKARTMASVRSDFAFKVVDPAFVADPDKRIRPVRSLIVLLGLFGGVMLAVIVSLSLDLYGAMTAVQRTPPVR